MARCKLRVALNTGVEGVDWIIVAQDGEKCMNCCEHGNELRG
jgi:hypothetical protein